MTPVTETLLQEMTDVIVEAVNPQRIILFGSHARGQAGPESDVDRDLMGRTIIAVC